VPDWPCTAPRERASSGAARDAAAILCGHIHQRFSRERDLRGSSTRRGAEVLDIELAPGGWPERSIPSGTREVSLRHDSAFVQPARRPRAVHGLLTAQMAAPAAPEPERIDRGLDFFCVQARLSGWLLLAEPMARPSRVLANQIVRWRKEEDL